ncbi:MAG: hypothetical protein ACREEN_07375, partial [Stellaceae bacterium]
MLRWKKLATLIRFSTWRVRWAALAGLAAVALLVRIGWLETPALAAHSPDDALAKLKAEFVRPTVAPFPADDPYSKTKAHLGD